MPTIPHNRIITGQLVIGRSNGITYEDVTDYLERVEIELGNIDAVGTGNQGGDSVVRRANFVLRNSRSRIPNWPASTTQNEDHVIGNETTIIGNEKSGTAQLVDRLFGTIHKNYKNDSLHFRDKQSNWNYFNGSYDPLLSPEREVVLRVAIRENGDYTQESGTTQKVNVILGTGDGSLSTYNLGIKPILPESEKIHVNDTQTSNYTIDYDNGTIETDETGTITASFTYFFNLFAGYLGDSIHSSPNAATIECECRDYAKILQDAYIIDPKTYGNKDGSIVAETVIQQIINDNIIAPDTVNTPIPSAFAITEYPIQYATAWDAVQNIATQRGWFLGYLHNNNNNQWELYFLEPPRDKNSTTADYTLTAQDDFYTADLDISSVNIRNYIKGIYRDKHTKKRDNVVVVLDQASVDTYRARKMQITEASTSLIDTKEEMTDLLNAALADLKDLTGVTKIEMPLFPHIDLFSGLNVEDSRISTTVDFYGVQSVRHRLNFKDQKYRTEVIASGKVTGAYIKWLKMQTRPGAGKPIEFPEQSKLTEAPDVTKFNVAQDGAGLLFTWEPIITEPVTYQIRRGLSWETGQVVAKSIQSDTYRTKQILKGTNTYFIKAIDLFGNQSINAAESTVTVNFLPEVVDVLFHDELAVMGGVMDNVIDLSDESGNRFGLPHLYTDQDLDIPAQDVPDEILVGSPVITGEGTYETQPIDMGGILSVYAITDIAGTNEPSTSRLLEIAHSNDNVIYSDWELFNGGQYEARYFKFRVTLISNGNMNVVNTFNIELDAPEYTQNDKNITVPAGGLEIIFPQAFNVLPAIIVVAIGDANARIVNQSMSGFTVKVVSDSGVDIGGVVNWAATGY